MVNSIKNATKLLKTYGILLKGRCVVLSMVLKDKSMWSDQGKKIQKMDRLARSILIQGIPNDINSLIDSNKTAKDLWDALARQMLGSEYGEQDRKAVVLYEYEMFKVTEGELLLDTYIRYLQVINDLKKCGYSKDNYELNFTFLNHLQPDKTKEMLMMLSDPLALIAEKRKVSKRKEKVVVSSDSKGSDEDDFSELKKITALVLKSDDKKEDKKVEEKKRDTSKIKCYNCKKECHFAKDCKKAKVKDYEYYKTKMFLAKKDKDKQVLLAEDHAWMESSSDLDQEINANMVFMAQIQKVLSDSEDNSLSSDDKIAEIIIDLEDEVVSLFVKEKENLETIESLKSKGFESSEKEISKSENQSENDCQVVKNVCDDLENPRYTRSAHACNNARNALCNAIMNDSVDVNDLFVLMMSKLNKSLPRIIRKWLPKKKPLAEPVAKWILRVTRQIDKIAKTPNTLGPIYKWVPKFVECL
nr:hypothetical protein [Tanacetum cinerariifolium]